ncbi:MAG: hypothetical protein K2X27_13505 [Candidatus Obscuribacterales bacterium]|nr:hypothetical protein [Candidatus Obscuribacterales bacterium]
MPGLVLPVTVYNVAAPQGRRRATVCESGALLFCAKVVTAGGATRKAYPVGHEVSKMAYGAKHLYDYEDDDGTMMSVRLSEQKAALDGFVLSSTARPMWARPTKWIRHVGVKDSTGKVRQYPCKNRTGIYNQVGSTGHSITVLGTVRANCQIVGRTGEKGGS